MKKTKGVFQGRVLSNTRIRECYWRLQLELDSQGSQLFTAAVPGQFAEFDLSNVALPPIGEIPVHLRDVVQKNILLRRPFSFSDISINPYKKEDSVKMEVLYCVLGPSTVRMMSLQRDDAVSILGPLGNGFWYPENLQNAVLIAGGMGAPPLQHLASYLKNQYPQVNVTAFAGARTCDHLPFQLSIGNIKGVILEEFDRLNVPSRVATDDGSAGFKGTVTDLAAQWINETGLKSDNTVIYACGPERMLAACAQISEKYSIPCQVSMERMMACGIGLCQSCAVQVLPDHEKDSPFRLCCKDGPVFDSRKVIFKE